MASQQRYSLPSAAVGVHRPIPQYSYPLMPLSCYDAQTMENELRTTTNGSFRTSAGQCVGVDEMSTAINGIRFGALSAEVHSCASSCGGATMPSYCEVQRSGQVHVTVQAPAAMKPCASSTSVVSFAKSDTDSSSFGPTCRICDSTGENSNRLISPCRCSGTSKFVHEQCLNKWLETINAHNAPRCEVCRYHIHTRKMYRIHNWRLPAVSSCDLVLHLVFIAAIIVLVASASLTVVGFATNHGKMAARRPGDALSADDVIVLVGGLTFFIAFIVALLTQIRAAQSLYRVVVSCVAANTVWRIDPYRRSDDSLYCK